MTARRDPLVADELLAGVRIDAATKGFPSVERPPGLAEVPERGWSLLDLPPPVLTLRRSAIEHNLALMTAYCQRHQVGIAPHAKTTMAPQLWAEQLEAGAWGLTVATAAQARVARAVGAQRVLVANELTDPASIS